MCEHPDNRSLRKNGGEREVEKETKQIFKGLLEINVPDLKKDEISQNERGF